MNCRPILNWIKLDKEYKNVIFSVDQKDQLNVPALSEHLKSVSFLNYNFIAHPWIAQCIQLSEGGSVLLIIKVSTATVCLF